MIFLMGSKGEDVFKIQQNLKRHGFYRYNCDGDFGPKTMGAVKEVQQRSSLNADGIVGPITWACLMGSEKPDWSKLDKPSSPHSRNELKRIFGDPLIEGFWKTYGAFCEMPKELDYIFTYKYKGKPGFWCHRGIILPLKRAFNIIVETDNRYLIKSFGGCYNLRNIRGGSKLSMHSWGIAIDLNVSENRLGSVGEFHKRPELIKIFEKEGFTWGGNFSRLDPMHFEYTKRGL